MEIKTDAYKNEGMYLHFPNGDCLDLSQDTIKQLGEEYWNNPSKLPPSMRENEYFKTCEVFPYRGQNVFCSAMKPLLPFLEKINNFVSYDKVTAVYVDRMGHLHVSDTAINKALQYVVNMSFFEYCEDVKQYKEYFRGIIPFMDLSEAVSHLFLNIYWLNKADAGKINETIKKIHYNMTNTSKSCIKRLNLICKSDAFMNAYVHTHSIIELLSSHPGTMLEQYFQN
jgi:hypothetical protein